MDIEILNALCKNAIPLGRIVDISMVQGNRGFALVERTNEVYGNNGKKVSRDVYQDYASIQYNECTVVDRYADNIKQLTNEKFKKRTTDAIFDNKSILVKSNNSLYKDGFIVLDSYHILVDNRPVPKAKNLKGEFAWRKAKKSLVVNIIKDNFNVYTLREILLDGMNLTIDCNVPCYLDGPIFDGVSSIITMKNLTLGPSALESYSRYLIRNGIEHITLYNKLMYQDNLHLLSAKSMSYSSCSFDLPILPLGLEKLELSMQSFTKYTVAYLNELNTLKVLCNNEIFILMVSELPMLIDLEIHDAVKLSLILINIDIINKISTLTVENSRIKDIEFPNVTTLKGDLYPKLLMNVPNAVDIVGYNINVLGDLVDYIPESTEILKYDKNKDSDKGRVDSNVIIPYYKKVLELPNLREVTYIIGLDYPYDPLQRKDVKLDVLIYNYWNFYSMNDRSIYDRTFGDEIKAAIMHNKRNNTLRELSEDLSE